MTDRYGHGSNTIPTVDDPNGKGYGTSRSKDLPMKPAEQRKRRAILSLAALTVAASMLGCGSDEDSCAQTATCPPSKSDAASDSPTGDGAGADVSASDRDAGRDGADSAFEERSIDGVIPSDTSPPDARNDSDATVVRDATSPDVRPPDAPADTAGQLDGLNDSNAETGFVDGQTGVGDAGGDGVGDAAGDGVGDASVPERDSPIVGDDVWAVGASGVVLHWTKSAGWAFETTPASSATIFDIWGTDRSNVWAVGNGDILHYDGMAWTSVPNPVPQSGLRAIWGSSRTDVWAVGYDNARDRALVLRYDGTSWSDQAGIPSAFVGESFLSIWGSGPRDVWVISIAKTFHFGANASWEEVITPDAGVGYTEAVWTSSPTDGWILGELGKILQLSAGGLSSIGPYPTTPHFKAVSGLSANEVWAIGWVDFDSTTKLFRNTGSGWADGPPISVPLMYDIFIRSPQDVWFAGYSGVIAHFDGLTVTPDPTVPTQAILYGVWGPR